MLWLNGGPGGSSIAAGLLLENGPCHISPDGNGTVRNDHAWNEKVNIIYLEQPVGTGYSYASDDSEVTNLVDLAADVYAFLQVFMHQYPEYSAAPFHIAAESWGGHYAPNIASVIFNKNKEIEYAPFPGQVKINLESVMIANGLTEPASQFLTIPMYFCGGLAPYPAYGSNTARCMSLRVNSPICYNAIKSCYDTQSTVACNAATVHCWTTELGTALQGQPSYYRHCINVPRSLSSRYREEPV